MIFVLSILSLSVIVELPVYFKLKNGSGDINRDVVAAIIYDVIVMMVVLIAFLGICARAVFRNRKHLKE